VRRRASGGACGRFTRSRATPDLSKLADRQLVDGALRGTLAANRARRRTLTDDPTETVQTATGIPPAGSRGSRFQVRVVHGNLEPTTVVVTAESEPLVFGRSRSCDVIVHDAHASSRHAEIAPAGGGGIQIRDLGSRNGTFVNGARVREGIVGHGDTIAIGNTLLRVTSKGDEAALDRRTAFGPFLGASPEVRRLFPLCERLARSDVPLVITGETGTGKEVLAAAIHAASPRAAQEMVVFDCTATPPNLIESALFGHEKGAFTGAIGSVRGVFEEAHGGTLLLDEIGDLELSLQAKLLRAIERKQVKRVGGQRWIEVDVRVIGATRRNLRALVAEGKFRDDLYYRLAVAAIELPPLRAREGEVAHLVRLFWLQLGGRLEELTPQLFARFEREPWPGNVRQLRNAVARELALGDLAIDDLPSGEEKGEFLAAVDRILEMRLPLREARDRVLAEFERRYVEKALEWADGRVGKAAELAGIQDRYFRVLRARGRTK
jgi:DNA-binding NtrC family response regulator